MTVSIKEFRKEQQLTSVRLVRDTNLSGTYSNGPINNGVGATLTTNANTLTVDSVAVENGNRVLLINQTNSFENGIYQISNVNDPDFNIVLTRTDDFQTFDQMRPGYYIPVSAGSTYNGTTFAVVEPQVQQVGVSGVTIVNTVINSDITSVLLDNMGLNVRGSDEGFHLTIVPNQIFTANRHLYYVNGDSDRIINVSAGDVTFSAYGNSVVAAANKNALQALLGIKGGTSNDNSAGSTRAFIALGVLSTDLVFVSVLTSGSAASIDSVVPSADTITVAFSGDPGNTTIRWLAVDKT